MIREKQKPTFSKTVRFFNDPQYTIVLKGAIANILSHRISKNSEIIDKEACAMSLKLADFNA